MKIFKPLLAVCIAAIFTGCGNFVEEITLDENGNGTYKVYTDVIPSSIEVATQMTLIFAKMDTTQTLNEDSLRMAMAAKVWEDFPGEIDSTFAVNEELPEEVRTNPDYQKYAEGAQGFMKGGKDAGYVNAGMQYAFKDAEDFKGFINFMESAMQSDQANQAAPGPLGDLVKTKSKSEYNFHKNKFGRTVTYTNPQDLEGDDSIDKLADIMGENGKYQTVVRTKRKIKKVKGENIKEQTDYKVVFEYNFMEVMTGNANTDFEIIFE